MVLIFPIFSWTILQQLQFFLEILMAVKPFSIFSLCLGLGYHKL